MSKKDEFRNFVRNKPELIDYVKNNEMTWQGFYEIYDLYGEDASHWDSYRAVTPGSNTVGKFGDIVKNIDVNSIQKHIETAQKALGFVEDLTVKSAKDIPNIVKPTTPRPINKFFED